MAPSDKTEIQAATVAAGLPPPALEGVGPRLRVTLSTERVNLPVLDPADTAMLDALSWPKGGATIDFHYELPIRLWQLSVWSGTENRGPRCLRHTRIIVTEWYQDERFFQDHS